MSQFRMGDPQYRPHKAVPTVRNRIIAVLLKILGVPLMAVVPLAFLGLPIDGIGYLTGHGEAVIVTVERSASWNLSPASRNVLMMLKR